MNSNRSIRIKICGITRVEDALMVAEAGADAIGLVFYPDSPRNVSINTAKAIVEHLPPFINTVGLFVDADEGMIKDILEQVSINTLQFHGQESEQACALYGKPYIKAIRMRESVNLETESERYASASALLLDTYVKGLPGGTGQSFEWDKIPSERNTIKPIILAGGLTEDNVKGAIKQTRPYAVDVSGGVESAQGIKDRSKVINFIREALNA